jgi:uncharacterized protein
MTAEIVYYVWAVLLLLANVCAWGTTFFTLPGNWLVLALTALFAWLVQAPSGGGIGWGVVGALAVLAALGEVVEFAAGAAGAAKQGGSRRGMILAIFGSLVGSVGGSIVGTFLPIPLVGTLVGAIGGGALGAFGGAYAGETWKGRSSEQRMSVSSAALVGRLFGTVGKLAFGVVMVVIATVDSFIN